MKRTLSTALAAASLVVVTIGLAQPAMAITNPADNPRPITVKGDDGKTYTDGEDTLPGYDDEACTYIPGAYFDFDNNRVRYADGQSIPWTEWERATGYKEWKAKQSKPAAPATPKATTPAATKTTAPKAPSKPKPAATAKPATSGKSAADTPSSATPKPTASATPTEDVDAAGTDTKPAGDEPTSEPSAVPEVATATDDSDEVALASDESETTKASAEESDGTGSAGLLILAGLAGAGALAYAGYTVVARRKGQAS